MSANGGNKKGEKKLNEWLKATIINKHSEAVKKKRAKKIKKIFH